MRRKFGFVLVKQNIDLKLGVSEFVFQSTQSSPTRSAQSGGGKESTHPVPCLFAIESAADPPSHKAQGVRLEFDCGQNFLSATF